MGHARHVVAGTIAVLGAALLTTSIPLPAMASSRAVSEFGCALVDTTGTFNKVPEEDCPPGGEAACFDEPVEPPVAVGTHIYPTNCRWVTAQSSEKVATATCPSGTFVFSGGCAFDNRPLGVSSPWEIDPTNAPDPGEAFIAVSDPNGWMCVPSGDPFTVPNTSVAALCCEQSPDIDALRETLQDCGWSRSGFPSAAGGVIAYCPSWTVPIASGLHASTVDTVVPPPIEVLAPAGWWGTADGLIDGEPLADDHAIVHGEPPQDGTTLSAYVGDLSTTKGTGKHFAAPNSVPQEILTLCCAVPLPPPHAAKQKYPYGGGKSVPKKLKLLPGAPQRLRSCMYESALLPPAADLANPPQYVAKLACRNGTHVLSGGCYPQFRHTSPSADLAGSYPYENGDFNDLPNSGTAPGNVSGENGWACRLDRAPQPFVNGPAKVDVEAICCD